MNTSIGQTRGICEAQSSRGGRGGGARLTIGVLLIAAFGATLALDLPGHLSYDSANQLLEGRTGHYGGWHPPVMSWLLGLADNAVSGTCLYVFLQDALFFGTLGGILLLPRRASWLGVAALIGSAALPQIVLYQGIVWKDVLFADAALAGFVCLATAARAWGCIRVRYTSLMLACLFFALAALARQNGALILPFGAISIGWTAAIAGEARKWRIAALHATAFLLLSGLTAFAAEKILDWRSANQSTQAQVQLRLLETYDLIGAKASEPSVGFDVLRRDAPALYRAIQHNGVELYTPRTSDTLHASPVLLAAIAGTQPSTVARQWRALIWQHPALYFSVRAKVFRWTFLAPEIGRCVPFIVGVKGAPDTMRSLKMPVRMDGRDRVLLSYAGSFLHTPVFSHLFFALLALALIAALLIRHEPQDIAIACMLAASLTFAASFFVISIACDYRYLYFLDIAAITSLFYCGLDPRFSKKPRP